MRKTSTFVLFISLACLGACVTAREEYPRVRSGVKVFDPKINLDKPVAAADFSGWHATKDGILVGVLDSVWVVAYSLPLNRVLWFSRAETDIASPLTVAANSVFAGQRDGKLLRINLTDGKQLWTSQLDTFVARNVTVVKDRVFAVSAGQQLYCLRLDTGTHEWIHDAGFPEGLTMQGAAAPFVVDEIVYLGLASGELQAVSLATGRPAWREEASDVDSRFHDVIGDIALVNGRLVFARYDGQLLALTVTGSSGVRVWEDRLTNISSTAFHNGVFAVGTNLGEVALYQAESGKKLWSTNTGVAITALTLTDKVVFAGGSNGRINALDRKDGKLYWTDDIMGRILTKPFSYKGSLYFPTGYKNLYGYVLK